VVVFGAGVENSGDISVIEFPRRMSLFMRTMRLVPDALYERMMIPYARRKTG